MTVFLACLGVVGLVVAGLVVLFAAMFTMSIAIELGDDVSERIRRRWRAR
jgi:hypothetical protein